MSIIKSYSTDPIQLLTDESIFSTSNQVLGVRGNFSEGYGAHYKTIRGTYINGIFGEYNYCYGEKGYAFPDKGQIIINLPDPQTIYIKVNETIVDLEHAKLLDVQRSFDTVKGIVKRKATYETKEGYRFIIEEKRLTSLKYKEVFLLDYQVTSVNFEGEITLISTLDGGVTNLQDDDDPRMSDVKEELFDITSISSDLKSISILTKKTNFAIHVAMEHDKKMGYEITNKTIVGTKKVHLKQHETFSLRKYVVYTTSKHHQDMIKENQQVMNKILKEDLYHIQEESVKKAHIHDVINVYNEDINKIIHYNLYQLYTSGGADEHSNIAAKGLSGEGYEGHYFWDTDIYMFMFFLMNNIEIAKNLLMFRYHTLDEAIIRARELGHKRGAKYPWRTIDGKEVSPYYPAGTAQYHINAAIAHSFIQYYHVTNDVDFIIQKGFKVLYETAMIYLEIGNFYNGEFHINNVTGPDEYTAVVNNNYYTNKMAQHHMRFVIDFYQKHKDVLKEIADEDTIQEMVNASEQMVLPFDQTLNIYAQDDHFLSKKRLDFSQIRKPMLLHYHPLSIYRAQVCKQADVVLAHYLLDDEPMDVMRDSLNYYEAITTHDSSLSKCIYSIMYSRVGNIEKAYEYFDEQLRMDIDNTLSNTHHGLHVANLGGTYLTIVSGFLGLRTNDGLSIRPYLPTSWPGYEVNMMYRGVKCHFKVTSDLEITTNHPIDITVYGQKVTIDGTKTFSIK
jgi:alpha,alpha-trehalose phosphorylase